MSGSLQASWHVRGPTPCGKDLLGIIRLRDLKQEGNKAMGAIRQQGTAEEWGKESAKWYYQGPWTKDQGG